MSESGSTPKPISVSAGSSPSRFLDPRPGAESTVTMSPQLHVPTQRSAGSVAAMCATIVSFTTEPPMHITIIGDVVREAEVPNPAGARETADSCDLDVHDLATAVVYRSHDVAVLRHALVERERLAGVLADGEALLVGQAWLLEPGVCVGDRVEDPNRLPRGPSTVRVVDELFVCLAVSLRDDVSGGYRCRHSARP
jgi:hypothetical protein